MLRGPKCTCTCKDGWQGNKIGGGGMGVLMTGYSTTINDIHAISQIVVIKEVSATSYVFTEYPWPMMYLPIRISYSLSVSKPA